MVQFSPTIIEIMAVRPSALSIISLLLLAADLGAGGIAFSVFKTGQSAPSAWPLFWLAAGLAALAAKEFWRRKGFTLAINALALLPLRFLILYWARWMVTV
ncbi:MAG TPA: hypothetical protein PKI19_13070 [Elusimicrobiales bacterium]|nr:hypothetical protein [Elusimicrobiales bacterium]